MNEFIKEMLQLGAELEKTESPMQASMIINDAEILYRDEIKALTIPVVSKCYTEKDMDGAYDKGFNDGNQRDLTGSLIEVL